MKFLYDTNVLSEVMRRSPHPEVKLWLNQQEFMYLSAITVEEIYAGLAYKDAKRQREWFEKLLTFRAEVLAITSSIANRCGTLRRQFRKKGILRTQADLLIAATAYEHNLVLATRNVRDFEDCGIQIFNPFNIQQ